MKESFLKLDITVKDLTGKTKRNVDVDLGLENHLKDIKCSEFQMKSQHQYYQSTWQKQITQ